MYMARARPCTVCTRPWAAVYRLCTRAINTAVYTAINTAFYTAVNTAVYTVMDGPCTWPVHGRVQSVHGRGRPCTDCARPPSAVYKLCTRLYTGHAHGPSVSRTRPCKHEVRGKTRPGTRPVPDRVRTVYMAVRGPCTVYTAVYMAVFTARVHGRVRTMYTAVHGPSMTRTRPCTRSCTLYTAVFTARVQYTARKRPCTADGHGRVYGLCTRPCTVYMHVFVACVYGRPPPCTDCVRAMYIVRS